MSKKELHVTLLTYSSGAAEAVAMGAKLCYSSADIDALKEKVDSANQSAFIAKLADMGHESPIEHAGFTFGIEGVSRALLAQLTRHRLASFSVQSQRYVGKAKGELDYIVPPAIEALGEDAIKEYRTQMQTISGWYDRWLELMGESRKEDARFVLPNAAETRMVMTMNARELRHMFALRCCNRAQWEIRALAWAMYGLCIAKAPELFDGCAPSCVKGCCTEGRMSCGRQAEMKQKYEELAAFVEKNKESLDFDRLISGWACKNIAGYSVY